MAEKRKSPGSTALENIQAASNIRPSDLARMWMIGVAERGQVGEVITIDSMPDYVKKIGGPVTGYYSYYCAEAFFNGGGSEIKFVRTAHYVAGVSQAAKATKIIQGYNALVEDQAKVNTLKVDAWFEGDLGNSIKLNSLKAESVLTTQLVAGAITGLVVVSTAGFEVGDIVEVNNANSVNYFRSVVTEVTDATNLKIASVTITQTFPITVSTVKTASTHRNKTEMSNNYLAGVSKMVVANVTGLSVGSIVTIGDPTNNRMEVKKITRIDSNEITFDSVTSNAYNIADDVLIVSQEFNMSVIYAQVERGPFNYLSMAVENQKDYIETKINTSSNYFIEVEDLDGLEDDLGDIPLVMEDVVLAGGSDGLSGLTDSDFAGSLAYENGFFAFNSVKDDFYQIICVDNLSKTVQKAMYQYAEDRNIWAVGNIQFGKTIDEAVDFVVNDAILNTQYGEIQYPNIKKINSLTGAQILVPASGHIAGLNAKVWKTVGKGPHIQPAGTEDGVIQDIDDLENNLTDKESNRDKLDPNRINSLYRFSPWGILQYGINTLDASETLSQKGERITFLYAEHSIKNGTPWVVFKNIDSSTKGRVRRTIRTFLKGLWESGALKGLTEEEAFIIDVKSGNDAATEAAGEFLTKIGLATKKAGEFVYFEFSKNLNQV